MWLCLRRFPPLRLHKGILNSLCFLILLIHTKHKNIEVKYWTDPTYSFLLISLILINWVDKTENVWLIEFVIFKPQSYCFRQTIVFDIKTSYASRPLSRLIRLYKKRIDITKKFWEKTIQCHGTVYGLQITNWIVEQLIYLFYVHTTIRQKYMVLFHLVFCLCTTIRPKIRALIDLFLSFARDHSTKIYGPLSVILYFVHDH